jgi:hypothetical protein
LAVINLDAGFDAGTGVEAVRSAGKKWICGDVSAPSLIIPRTNGF